MHCVWKLPYHFSSHWHFPFNIVWLLDYTKRNKITWFCRGFIQKLSCIAMALWMSPTEELLRMKLSDGFRAKLMTLQLFQSWLMPEFWLHIMYGVNSTQVALSSTRLRSSAWEQMFEMKILSVNISSGRPTKMNTLTPTVNVNVMFQILSAEIIT